MLEMEPRYFNKIEILSEERLRKSSIDKFKIKAEYEWYNNYPFSVVNSDFPNKDVAFWIPSAYDFWEDENSAAYTMEYVHGYTLAWHFLYMSLDLDVFQKLIENFYSFIINRPVIATNEYTKMCIHSLYEDKTLERLAKTNIDLDKEYIVNDHKLPSIREIVSNCKVDLRDSDITHIHGDFCFANMICRPTSISFRAPDICRSATVYFIDPRGYLPSNIITTIGDNKYDVAKLAHSLIGRYEQIRNHGFEITKVSDREYTWACVSTDYQTTLTDTFKSIFNKDVWQYYEIMVHLFLSMIPLHKDSPEKQEKMLVNALRLYLERENKF